MMTPTGLVEIVSEKTKGKIEIVEVHERVRKVSATGHAVTTSKSEGLFGLHELVLPWRKLANI